MTDELKIIMETIGMLGQAGKEAFIWWLLVKYALHYFAVVVFLASAAFAICYAVRRITAMSHGNQLGQELCELLDIGDANERWDSEYYRAGLKAQIIEKVRKAFP